MQNTGQIGALLRSWRQRRGLSQLQLALDSGLSQRHLSFVESGKSAPSRHAVLTIAETLDAPLADRNLMLLAAGFAPVYPEPTLQDVQMQAVVRALKRMLAQHDPFPAVVMDRYWNVVMANASAPRFFNLFIDLDARPQPRNMLHLMFDPAGMRPFIHDWPAASASLIQRVRREAVGRYADDKTNALIEALHAYPEVDAVAAESTGDSPVVPLSFVKDGVTLNYFSIVSTVGTPMAVAAQELRIESMFPLDDATEAHHLKLMQ
jgi:transcriptional regulator with XRE-family HTH domain